MGDYRIGTDGLDLGLIHRWLSTDAYWAIGRPRDVVERSVGGSLNFGLFTSDGQQVGFARTVTDSATFAWLCDVYVDPAHRGRGLGRLLVRTVRDELHGLGVQRILLATKDAHGVYAALGFTELAEPWKWMELDTR
jgi:GNAT superfamily N-acetyltransferase